MSEEVDPQAQPYGRGRSASQAGFPCLSGDMDVAGAVPPGLPRYLPFKRPGGVHVSGPGLPTPEQEARAVIDAALARAGWVIQDRRGMNIHAAVGIAVREFPLKPGYGFADYVLYVDGEPVGIIEAKKAGTSLTGVEPQTAKYSEGVPEDLAMPIWPLPFLYESTGTETQFTNRLDPQPRSRYITHFHQPETLASWLEAEPLSPETASATDRDPTWPATLRWRIRHLPPLDDRGMRPASARAVRNLENSLAQDRPRALIQMATGSGKTVMAIAEAYRLIKFGDARRILFLVDRTNLGVQALKEFQAYRTPDDGRLFTELYNVQLLTSNKIDPVARVVITTIQRLYSILRGEPDLDPALEVGSQFDTAGRLLDRPAEVEYNPNVPIESFDLIFIDECHRSIYTVWRQVLEYFDAYLVGLTATPAKQTFGFFHQNLAMEYTHEEAVADGVNVDFGVYKIQTAISAQGATIETGNFVGRRHKLTRARRWERLDEDFVYQPTQLGRDVVAEDQLRTVVRTFRDKLFTEVFPGRTEVPKTLIYAASDAHADDIVRVVREEFDKPNEFCQKITYRTTGAKPEDLLQSFRNSYNPRIVVTVDMIATGTDIRPLEIVMFMRAVRSRNYFEQMKGRGVRVMNATDFRQVTPDAPAKTHFMIVDCVGVCDTELEDTTPLDRQPSVAFDKLLQQVAMGTTSADVLSTVASRLARLDRELDPQAQAQVAEAAGGVPLRSIVAGIVRALDPDEQANAARTAAGLAPDAEPPPQAIEKAAKDLLKEAARPLAANPRLREKLLQVKATMEQTIDTVTKDTVLFAGPSEDARERAQQLVGSFQRFLEEHKDDITALQILYSKPRGQRLRFQDVKALAQALAEARPALTSEQLWRAYEVLEKDRVRGAGAKRLVTDLVSLVKFAMREEEELVPFPEHVDQNFQRWMEEQEARGRKFTPEQRAWLAAIKNHVASSLGVTVDDFETSPFVERGGLARARLVFGTQLDPLLAEANEVLVA